VRFGNPREEAHLGNPEFMVRYALNLSDIANWQEVAVTLKDGSTTTVRRYLSPDAEQTHLQALRNAATEKESNFATQSALSVAVDDPGRLSSEGRSAAVAWARGSATAAIEAEPTDDGGELRMREEAVVTAAMIVMRDCDDALRAEHGKWARSKLDKALEVLDDDPARQVRGGLRFNPTAIAYTGLIHALRHRQTPENVRAVLEVAAAGNHAAAHGFGAAVTALEAVDGRFPRAVLRCAFSACVVEDRIWDEPQAEVDARKARSLERTGAAVTVEMAWLYGDGAEPQWPKFPGERARPRRRLRLPGSRTIALESPEEPISSSTEYANHQAAALWLRQVRALPDTSVQPWLGEIIRTYMPWTTVANGAELDDGDETDHPPSEWNDTFFAAAARCAVGLATDEITELAVRHIVALPDQNFYNVLVDFLRSVDALYFEGYDIPTQVAVDIRQAFAERMLTTRGWEHLSRSKSLSIEMHIGPAIAVLFFNDHNFGRGSKCYLFEKGAERIGPFLPVLGKLVREGPSPFVALVLLNLLEIAPRVEQLELLVSAGSTWIDVYPDFRQLWVDHAVGRRWCLLIEEIRIQSPTCFSHHAPLRSRIDSLIATLIALGVPEATRLEEELAKL